MKPEFIELIGNARNRQNRKFRNQLSIFLVCLLISFFLWISIKLSRDYYYTVDYQLRVKAVPASYELVTVSDSTLSVQMHLQGYDALTDFLFNPRRPVHWLDISQLQVHWHNGRYEAYLLTHPIGRDIAARLNVQSPVITTAPDTLFFIFNRRKP